MKKIDFKFSKRQVILFTAFLALLGVGIWSAGTLSASEPKTSQNALERVTEPIPAVESTAKTENVEKQPEISPNVVAQTTPEPAETTPAPAPVETRQKWQIFLDDMNVNEPQYAPAIVACLNNYSGNNFQAKQRTSWFVNGTDQYKNDNIAQLYFTTRSFVQDSPEC